MSPLPRPLNEAYLVPERAESAPSSRGISTYVCDVCGRKQTGSPGGAGLFVWTRGDEVRYEEPPLCEDCAARVTMAAFFVWDSEEEEG